MSLKGTENEKKNGEHVCLNFHQGLLLINYLFKSFKVDNRPFLDSFEKMILRFIVPGNLTEAWKDVLPPGSNLLHNFLSVHEQESLLGKDMR